MISDPTVKLNSINWMEAYYMSTFDPNEFAKF